MYDSVSKQRPLVLLVNAGWRQTTDLRIEDGKRTFGLFIATSAYLLASQQRPCIVE
jgi:hypothetical protein